jgi:hypothetical protein
MGAPISTAGPIRAGTWPAEGRPGGASDASRAACWAASASKSATAAAGHKQGMSTPVSHLLCWQVKCCVSNPQCGLH